MTALVGYGSSDSEAEEEVTSERPAKIRRLSPVASKGRSSTHSAPPPTQTPATNPNPNPTPLAFPARPTLPPRPRSQSLEPLPYPAPAPGPAPVDPSRATSPTLPSMSFHQQTPQQILQSLTMPTHPNFDIPSSPSPPHSPTSSAALEASTKKITKFLALKREGVHFNARLLSSAALRNPEVLGRMATFAGINLSSSEAEGQGKEGEERGGMYASTLADAGEGLEVPAVWPRECYVEALMEDNARRLKQRERERGKGGGVEFVGASGSGGVEGVGIGGLRHRTPGEVGGKG